jgi:universal stress protein E
VRFEDILFVHTDDPDDGSFPRALAIARRLGARFTLAGIVEPPSLDLLHSSGLAPDRLEQIALESERDALEALRARAGADAGVPAKALAGTGFLAVIREVLRAGHDLVMVPAPGALRVVDRILPSPALQLVRRCPCPVWLLRSAPEDGIRRVGAAVDADPKGERNELDRRILGAAFAVASAFSARVDVLHALALHPSESMLRGRGGMSEAEVEALVERVRSRADAAMRALVAESAPPGLAVVQHVLRGAPAAVIADVAREEQLDLLAIGTFGRTGIAGLVMGNTAEEILQRTSCSILALKPPGFVASD